MEDTFIQDGVHVWEQDVEQDTAEQRSQSRTNIFWLTQILIKFCIKLLFDYQVVPNVNCIVYL